LSKFCKSKSICLVSLIALVEFVVDLVVSLISSPILFSTTLTSIVISIVLFTPIIVVSSNKASLVVPVVIFAPIVVVLIGSVVNETLDMTTSLTKTLIVMLEVCLTKQEQGEQSECNEEERVSEHSIVVCY